MKGQMIVITPESTPATVAKHQLTSAPELQELKKHVGGYIELVPGFSLFVTNEGIHPCIAYCNEDGRSMGLPLNQTASEMWADNDPRYPLMGTIVILIGDQEFMNSL